MRTRTALAGGTLLFGLVLLPLQVFAAVVDLAASKDNTLYQEVDISNGAGVFMFAGKTAVSQIRRGLIKFDVAAGIPAGATINSATLKLNYDNPGTATNGTRTLSLRRATADWGQGTSDASGEEGAGAPAATGDATWIYRFFNTSTWGTQGGDFSGVTSASTVVTGTEGIYTWASATLTADVQSMLSAPAGNFGWVLLGDESTFSTAKRFSTREDLISGRRPMLTVDYTPGMVPALPSWGPLALATLLMAAAFPVLRRRRGEIA